MTLVVGILLTLLALSSTLGAGLELDLSRLQLLTLRKPLAAALAANLVVIPLASLLFLKAVDLPASSFVGLALVALSPGGASAPLLARLAGGEPTRVGALYVALCAGCLLTLGLVMPLVLDALLACVRNLTLALMIAEIAEPGGATTLVVAAYGLVMYVVASLCLLAHRRAHGGSQEYP